MQGPAPCLIVSHLTSRKQPENIYELHAGWVACREGAPFDVTQPPAWQLGYRWYQERELDKGIRALRQALWDAMPAEAPMPRVHPVL